MVDKETDEKFCLKRECISAFQPSEEQLSRAELDSRRKRIIKELSEQESTGEKNPNDYFRDACTITINTEPPKGSNPIKWGLSDNTVSRHLQNNRPEPTNS